jgi:hypothetical protein
MSKLFVLLCCALIASSYAQRTKSKDLETNIESHKNAPVFNRQLHQESKPESMNFESKGDNNAKHSFYFKVEKTDAGLLIKYKVQMNDTRAHENTRIMFHKVFTFMPNDLTVPMYTNETMENVVNLRKTDFANLVCQTLEHQTCYISTKNQKMTLQVDFSNVPFKKQFNNTEHQVFPTDIKITVLFNFTVPTNHSIGLITRFKTESPHLHEKEHELYENNKEVETGNLTYFSYETLALNQDNATSINVDMTNVDTDFGETESSDDEEEDDDDEHPTNKFTVFTFSSDNTMTQVIWDPVVGATSTFTGVDLTQQSTSGSSSSGFPNWAIGVIVGSVCAIVLVAGAIYKYRK